MGHASRDEQSQPASEAPPDSNEAPEAEVTAAEPTAEPQPQIVIMRATMTTTIQTLTGMGVEQSMPKTSINEL